jgi:spermidine synthase
LGRLRLLLLAVAVSGFVSFSYEVLWTRLLSFRLRTTVYAFSVMLATFLLGLGLGGALVGLSRKKRAKADYWRIYGYLEAAIGVCGLCTIFLLLAPRLDWASFVGRTVQQFGMSALIMLVPATLMGAAFPIACHLFASGVSQTGRSVGSMYVVNTIGAVAGALLTGFYLVRALGTQHSLALASFVIIASGSLILVLAPPSASRESSRARPRRSVLVHVILIWAVAIGLWSVTPRGLLPTYYVRHQPQGPERQLLGYHEGLEGVAVASELPDGDRLLSVGATIVAGTAFKLRNTQKLQAHIPMLVHPDPKEVCQVGFGSGETARIFASYDVDRFDCVEISPGVIEMADEHFRDINDGIVHKPNFNAIIMDATVYLKYTDRRYDVIANDATWPHLGGAWALFTLEYFQEGRERLKPDGIMTSWLPLDLPLLDLKSLLKSFHEVFPHVYLWSALSHQNKHALLIGSDHELQIDARQFMNRFDRFARDDLQIVNLDDPAAFLTCHLATMADMGPELAATPLNTQDRPTLQFLTRRLTSSQRMVADAHKLLAPHEDSVMNHLTGAEALPGGERLLSRIRTLQRANEQLLEALAMAMDSPSRVKLALDRAARLAPDHPFFAAVRQMRQELLALSAEQIRKRNVYSLRNLAQQLGREGLYDRALVALKEWERKEPDSADVHERLGACYLELGQSDKAIEHLLKAVELAPDSGDARFNLGTAYIRTRQIGEAISQLNEAVRLEPDSAEAVDRLGTAVALSGDRQGAYALFQRAIALDPDLANARNDIALLLIEQGDAAAALPHLEKLVELQPESPESHYRLSTAYQMTGNKEAAARHLRLGNQLRSEAAAAPQPAQ